MITYLDNSGKEVRRTTITNVNNQRKKHIIIDDHRFDNGAMFPYL